VKYGKTLKEYLNKKLALIEKKRKEAEKELKEKEEKRRWRKRRKTE